MIVAFLQLVLSQEQDNHASEVDLLSQLPERVSHTARAPHSRIASRRAPHEISRHCSPFVLICSVLLLQIGSDLSLGGEMIAPHDVTVAASGSGASGGSGSGTRRRRSSGSGSGAAAAAASSNQEKGSEEKQGQELPKVLTLSVAELTEQQNPSTPGGKGQFHH